MEYKLTLSVFRFDAKTDYLAYQKKYILKIAADATVANVLDEIKKDEKSFGYPTDANAAIVINGCYLFTKTKIKKIVEEFGCELTFEPLSSRRAVKDLLIDDNDFQAKFDILDAFVDAPDKKLYKKLNREYYASTMLDFNDDYIGDAVFAFAYDMIQKYPERETSILQAIADEDNGIWKHLDITNKLYPFDDSLQEKVDSLKNLILQKIPSANCFTQEQQKRASSL